nr:MAG TPA_asm: hypothetical protein [Caudoviricetes sp.]
MPIKRTCVVCWRRLILFSREDAALFYTTESALHSLLLVSGR